MDWSDASLHFNDIDMVVFPGVGDDEIQKVVGRTDVAPMCCVG